MTIILNGGGVASELNYETGKLISYLRSTHDITPHLSILMMGDDSSSRIYIRNKKLEAERLGMWAQTRTVADKSALIQAIEYDNRDEEINGIIIQLPIPGCDLVALKEILDTINPIKDVDGLTTTNLGNIAFGVPDIVPATPLGIVKLLSHYNISTKNKHIVIDSKSNIVGKPLTNLLIHHSGAVTWCHRDTPNLGAITKQADILIVAVGKPNLITADMVKEGATIIDVGITRLKRVNGGPDKIVGDVDFDSVYSKVSAITPVPGGVGPMTVAALLRNTALATLRQHHLEDNDVVMSHLWTA